ncbi:MAG: DUF4349 domain-containing protein [Anaerolineales bacterium]|nr:DUF4349 domain-containing protein [Anaerolineales bacterium]
MKKKYLRLALAGLLSLGLLLSACAAAAPAHVDGFTSEGVFEAPGLAMDMRGEAAAMPAMEPSAGGASAPNAAPSTNSGRLVIRHANLSIVVDAPEQRLEEIAAMAERMGGFVVNSNVYKSSLASGIEVPRGHITIRVPTELYHQALDEIRAGAYDVPSDSQSGQDVTAEYTDLQSRLRNLQAAETLLRQIMEEADDTEDVLYAFHELNRITEQIEVLRGQIKFYEESAALSAISVEIIANAAVQPIRVGPWSIEGAARQALEDLVRTLQNLTEFLVWVVLYLLPVLVVIALPVWLISIPLRRWLANRKSKKPASRVKK